MQYPAVPRAVIPGLTLLIPDPDVVRNMYEAEILKDPQIPFPYWTRIWPAAQALAAFLLEEPAWIKGKAVLEMGAGIGVPSFAVAHMTGRSIVSDNNPDAVELVRQNIKQLQLTHVYAEQIDWNSAAMPEKVDTLLMSDINYDPNQFKSLMTMIQGYKAQETDIIITSPIRMSTRPFYDVLMPDISRTFVRSVDGTDIAFCML
jgi:predicted nicotinamide N-methyase